MRWTKHRQTTWEGSCVPLCAHASSLSDGQRYYHAVEPPQEPFPACPKHLCMASDGQSCGCSRCSHAWHDPLSWGLRLVNHISTTDVAGTSFEHGSSVRLPLFGVRHSGTTPCFQPSVWQLKGGKRLLVPGFERRSRAQAYATGACACKAGT